MTRIYWLACLSLSSTRLVPDHENHGNREQVTIE